MATVTLIVCLRMFKSQEIECRVRFNQAQYLLGLFFYLHRKMTLKIEITLYIHWSCTFFSNKKRYFSGTTIADGTHYANLYNLSVCLLCYIVLY